MDNQEAGICLVLCTAAPDKSEELVNHLVKEGLAACINIFPVKSTYIWKGELCHDHEDLLIIKTSDVRAEELKDEILKIHSYNLPEIIVIPVSGGYEDYLEWVRKKVEICY